MRRYLFGWICKLRGYHKSAAPQKVQGVTQTTDESVSGWWLKFVCLCGAEELRHADIARGGRVTVPVIWGSR